MSITSFSPPSKPKKIEVTYLKKGRKTIGGIYDLPSGAKCFLSHQKVGDIYRADQKSIAEAIRNETACWAISEDIIIQMRATGIKFIGVLCKDTGDRFITTMDKFFDPVLVKITMVTRNSYMTQRCLPFKAFARKSGKRIKK